MTDVRNQRLAAARYTDTASHVLFSVPLNTVIILKSVLGGTYSAIGTLVVIVRSIGITDHYLLFQTNAAVNTPYLWSAQLAMNPGDALIVQGPAGDHRWWASGAVLLGGPPFTSLPTTTFGPMPEDRVYVDTQPI